MLDKVMKIDNYSKSLNMQLFFCFVFLIVQHCRNNMLQYIVLLLISWEISLYNGVASVAADKERIL